MKTTISAMALVAVLSLPGCATPAVGVTPEAVQSEVGDVEAVKVSSALASYDEGIYALKWTTSVESAPVDVFVSSSPEGSGAVKIADDIVDGAYSWTPETPEKSRRYFIVQPEAGERYIVATRVLPLEQASNFRDIGGYLTKDGHMVKWGRAYRSGAMPLLTDSDYAFIEQLDLDSVVDFRSLEEREVTPDQVDDRTGALFIANDYSMASMMKDYAEGNGENGYAKMEPMIRPQYRSMFRRLIADDGAVLYHCSAGQDRTGVATALIYDFLGVDRQTIVEDYHLSTELRRTKWEMPDINPADYPNNFIVQYYVAARQSGDDAPQPLYTPSGASQIVQFFDYIDSEFGSTEAYLKEALGLSEKDLTRLREVMLD
jgi:protein-tyrosine phosphatase